MRLIAAALVLAGCAEGGGRAPSLEMVDDQVVAVGEELVVHLRATDPDGDELFYDFDAPTDTIAEAAELARRPDGTAVFWWTPMAEDVGLWALDYVVSDGESEDRVTASVEVTAGGAGAPVFRAPMGSGTTFDPDASGCLELAVVVDDADDSAVELDHDGRIADATFEQTEGLRGTWTWCPKEPVPDRVDLVLTADDGVHEPTEKHFLIVVREPDASDPKDPSDPADPTDPPKPEPEPCEDDAYEDNDSLADAADNGGLPPGSYPDLVACAGDEDWFRIDLFGDAAVSFSADAVELTLYDHRGDPVDDPSCLPVGAYYVQALGDDTPYTLELGVDECAM